MRYRKIHDSTWRALQRDELLIKQNGRCAYCLKSIKRTDATLDHVTPKALGGTDNDELAASCYDCNEAKAAMSATAYKKLLRTSGSIVYEPNGDLTWHHYWLIKQQGMIYRLNAEVDRSARRVVLYAKDMARALRK